MRTMPAGARARSICSTRANDAGLTTSKTTPSPRDPPFRHDPPSSTSNSSLVPFRRMAQRRDDLAGVDDLVAEQAFARRALLRRLADEPSCVRSHPGLAHGPASATPGSVCGRQFMHPHRPTEFDAFGYLVVDTCACLRASGHDRGCLCAYGIEREHPQTGPHRTR